MIENDSAAQIIGAVNTVRRGANGWQGTNTDWQGARDALDALGARLDGAEVLLIGAGGTARAVLHALSVGSVLRVYICNRSAGRLQGLMNHAAEAYPDLQVRALDWEKHAVEACARQCPVVINTTSIGLGEAAADFPFAIGGAGVALDAVYAADGRTPFVVSACRGGRRAVDGLSMLLAQGAASFAWWHGIQTDVPPVMNWIEERLGRCRADRLQ